VTDLELKVRSVADFESVTLDSFLRRVRSCICSFVQCEVLKMCLGKTVKQSFRELIDPQTGVC